MASLFSRRLASAGFVASGLILTFVADRCSAQAQATAPPPVAKDTKMVGLPATNDGLPGAGPIRREDWFRPIWNERREQFESRRDRDQDAVVFFGDSITQGWGDDFRGKFGDLKVANRGISGDTTRG